jgi:hypothetical protein
MASFPQVAHALQHVLSAVPSDLARSSGFCQRHSKVTAACFVETMVLGWLAQPRATLHQVTQCAVDRGVHVTPQGLAQRLTPAAAALLRQVWEAALTDVIGADPVATPLLARLPAVLVMDSTTVSLPDALAAIGVGCGGRVTQGSQSALKLTVRLDLRTGRLERLPGDGRAQDKSRPRQHAELPPGALRITDLGFWSRDVLGQIAAPHASFLSRLHLQTIVFAADGERLDLVTWLPQQQWRRLSVAVTLGVAKRLPARLLAVRVPPRVAVARREVIRADAKRDGEPPRARKLALADGTLLVTNAPPPLISIRAAVGLARARWQIELLFKLWNSHGPLDDWRSTNPDRILCELDAKVTALLMQHWILLVGCWLFADRSWTAAAQTIRDHTIGLLLALSAHRQLTRVLVAIGANLAHGGRINPPRRTPNLFQLLSDPACGGLA